MLGASRHLGELALAQIDGDSADDQLLDQKRVAEPENGSAPRRRESSVEEGSTRIVVD